MRPGKGGNNFGQRPEMQMNHAADGMMMIVEITVDGKRPEASGTL